MNDLEPAPAAPPFLGARVYYRGKVGYHAPRAADVSCSLDVLDPRGVAAGQVPALTDSLHVHLHVLTPSLAGSFPEFDVPYDPGLAPGTWAWVLPPAGVPWAWRADQPSGEIVDTVAPVGPDSGETPVAGIGPDGGGAADPLPAGGGPSSP